MSLALALAPLALLALARFISSCREASRVIDETRALVSRDAR